MFLEPPGLDSVPSEYRRRGDVDRPLRVLRVGRRRTPTLGLWTGLSPAVTRTLRGLRRVRRSRNDFVAEESLRKRLVTSILMSVEPGNTRSHPRTLGSVHPNPNGPVLKVSRPIRLEPGLPVLNTRGPPVEVHLGTLRNRVLLPVPSSSLKILCPGPRHGRTGPDCHYYLPPDSRPQVGSRSRRRVGTDQNSE